MATLTLNRPEAHTTLSIALLAELGRALASLASDRDGGTGRQRTGLLRGRDVREICTLNGRDAVARLFALCG